MANSLSGGGAARRRIVPSPAVKNARADERFPRAGSGAGLSKLLARVEAGEEIVIARGKTPIARLTPLRAPPAARCFGALEGIVTVGPEFFEPMTDAELAEREERAAASTGSGPDAPRRSPLVDLTGLASKLVCL
jgi:antitoxin (DNA-binding transcriptional repressor) of toxin-antitoxin stability system